MLKKVTESTASQVIGLPQSKPLLSVPSGTYAGRKAAIVQVSTSEVKLFWSDHPYTSWSSGQSIGTDFANESFDAAIDSDGNIHVMYSEQSTLYLVTRKLTFSGGVWSVGSKVIVYNGSKAYEPSVAIEPSGKLWVSYSQFVSPTRNIHAKSSTDDGLTWGSGPADAGDSLAGIGTTTFSKLLIGPNDIFVITSVGSIDLKMESRPISGGSWSTPFNIVSGGNTSEDFDAAISPDGRLSVAFRDINLKYREYDGTSWSSILQLATIMLTPQIFFRNSVPVIIFLVNPQGAQRELQYVERTDGVWSSQSPLDSRASVFDHVMLFDGSSLTFENLTSASSSTATSDVFHAASSSLLKNSGDKLYFGMDKTFRYIQSLLSTAGIGGVVNYSYWDGSGWVQFSPDNGISHFDNAINRIILWQDYEAIPTAWQKSVVNSQSAFWIKVEVTSTFTTAPVGSYLTAISELYPIQVGV